jgi:pyruvate dehydrogenase E2 component (dihydrolipoyllysine-residue acetyltransferase)
MTELTMPRLSDTMQEGTLARWLKKPGERVEKGDIVAEIETDKATMELEAYDAGVLEQILVQEGQTVPIGQAIAVVGAGGGAAAAAPAPQPAATAAPVQPAATAAPVQASEPVQPEQPAGSPPEPATRPEPASRSTTPPTPEPASNGQIKASPMARAIARERGIDLQTIHGSGPGGRIIRADVEAAVAEPSAAPASAPATGAAQVSLPPAAAGPATESPGDVEEIPLTPMRRAVARRMVESVQSAPHFFLTSVVDAEALVALRVELNDQLADQGLKLSLNDLIVKACATALRANPDANVAFAGDKILRHKRVHIGVAVALEGGLIVPVLRDADQKSLSQLAREAKTLADKAHAGKLTPAEYSAGTFTISNLGMFGIDHFTAIINPPEAAILAVGAAQPEVVAREGQPVVRQTMKLTLSIDHRALDGATAARFLQQLKGVLENPLRMLV